MCAGLFVGATGSDGIHSSRTSLSLLVYNANKSGLTQPNLMMSCSPPRGGGAGKGVFARILDTN